MKKIWMLTMAMFLVFAVQAEASTWKIDQDHSAANFSVRHMAITNVKGSFPDVSGMLKIDDSTGVPLSFEIIINVESVNTGVEKRDIHLKSPDFFDVANHAAIQFVSKTFSRINEEQYQMTGDLTMHGVTKEVSVTLHILKEEMKDMYGNIRKGAEITGKIDRKDFGIVYNAVLENGTLVIGETVDMNVDLQFIKESLPAS